MLPVFFQEVMSLFVHQLLGSREVNRAIYWMISHQSCTASPRQSRMRCERIRTHVVALIRQRRKPAVVNRILMTKRILTQDRRYRWERRGRNARMNGIQRRSMGIPGFCCIRLSSGMHCCWTKRTWSAVRLAMQTCTESASGNIIQRKCTNSSCSFYKLYLYTNKHLHLPTDAEFDLVQAEAFNFPWLRTVPNHDRNVWSSRTT